MINFQTDNLSLVTPEGAPTLWCTFRHFRQYIIENYGWNALSTQTGHESRIESIIKRAIPDHDTIGIDQYSSSLPAEIRSKMDQLGKLNGEKYDDDTLKQFEYLIRYVLDTAEAHYLRLPENATDPKPGRTGIFLGHSDLPAVRHYLYPDEELAILKAIIPQLTYSGEARLILIQMASGERENEACGANWSMLCRDPNTGVCMLKMPQSTILGKNKVKLGGKSDNAPRIIVISEFVFMLLMNAKAQLLVQWLAAGNSERAFEDLPIGCKGENLHKRCSTKSMTDFANQLFRQIGIRDDELAALSAELVAAYHERRDAGLYADINDYRSPTCYLLRRSAATHMVALGYSESDRQYSLGHRIEDPTVDRRLYCDETKQIELFTKVNMRPLLNPARIKEHHLQPGTSLSLRGHEATIIVEPGTTCVILQPECNEPGDGIEITIEQACDVPQNYTLITREMPLDPEFCNNNYTSEINILSYYHALYSEEIDDFNRWLSKHVSEQANS